MTIPLDVKITSAGAIVKSISYFHAPLRVFIGKWRMCGLPERQSPERLGTVGHSLSIRGIQKHRVDNRPVADEPSIGRKNDVSSFIRKSYIATGADQTTFSLYCKGGNRSLNITIYGIIRYSDQDFVVKSVQAEMPKRGWKRVYLRFLEREKWIPSGSGHKRRRKDTLWSCYRVS